MSILTRFATIMKSNINALLDKCEDPAKMVDQMLYDLREDLAEVKKETANVMAAEKRAKRDLDECEENISRYDSAAREALKAGAEDDARQLIAKKQRYVEQKASLTQAYNVAHTNADKMRQMHDKLVGDINDLDARRASIKAKAAAAKAQSHVNEVIAGGPDAKASLEAFDRLEDKVDAQLDAANAEAELNADMAAEDDLADKYLSGGSASVDSELEAMKKDLGL